MATGTGHIWFDVFQAANTTAPWVWQVGEREHHWTFSYRPFQANSDAEILRHFVTSDNDLVQTDHIFTRTSTGNTFRMSASWVSGA
jgi:hypothetical protein